KITPLPTFRETTNTIEIRVKYQIETGGRVVPAAPEHHKQDYYVIIGRPQQTLGDVFISFKQPEDLRLANILTSCLERAGFTPHMFIHERDIGAAQWDTIEGIIKTCHSAVIAWSDKTDFGEGVQKEIELCRKHRVREIPLLERGVTVPSCF